MMILRDSHSQAPGHCRLCQSAVTPVLDTGCDYDSDGFGGVLYICLNCGREIAQKFGFVAPERLADLEDELNRTLERLDEQETENANLAAEIATVKETVKIVTAEAPVKRSPGRPRKTL